MNNIKIIITSSLSIDLNAPLPLVFLLPLSVETQPAKSVLRPFCHQNITQVDILLF